jgi:hypothetical protein
MVSPTKKNIKLQTLFSQKGKAGTKMMNPKLA